MKGRSSDMLGRPFIVVLGDGVAGETLTRVSAGPFRGQGGANEAPGIPSGIRRGRRVGADVDARRAVG